MKMLIVDDEAFAREAVIESIDWKQYGLDVCSVSSGEEGLKYMAEYNIDIVMTDIKMPGMSGLDFIDRIHLRGEEPAIIVLSSFNEFDLVRSAMQRGAEDYLFKPSMLPKDIVESVLKVKKRYEKRWQDTHNHQLNEFLNKLIQGKRMGKAEIEDYLKKGPLNQAKFTAVVSVRMNEYNRGLLDKFQQDIGLLQFTVKNVMQESLEAEFECIIINVSYKEYFAAVWKGERMDMAAAERKLRECLSVGFHFLKSRFDIDLEAGISRFSDNFLSIEKQYIESVEQCTGKPGNEKLRFAAAWEETALNKTEIRKALAYIMENLGNSELSLVHVSDHVGMSKNYFSKLFKDSVGENFISYITRLRMEYARKLYLESDMKVYEIAEKVGYSDWHYFYNLYKKTFGHSLSYEKNR